MDIMKLMQQAQQMQGQLQQIQEELATRTVTGTAGGGMVTVEADGKGACGRSDRPRASSTRRRRDARGSRHGRRARLRRQKARALEESRWEGRRRRHDMPFQLPF
jgi:hypothetical protein